MFKALFYNRVGSLFFEDVKMQGHFYFIEEQYFIDFPDKYLMKNKEVINGVEHNRPSFLSFVDTKTGLQWMIPISSKVQKYKNIYNNKTANGKKCDAIAFGHVIGYQCAFLIQNMFPVTQAYIKNEYLDSVSRLPVRLPQNEEAEIISKAQKVLSMVKNQRMTYLIFPNVLTIEKKLLGIS